jgi:hypothetical protein
MSDRAPGWILLHRSMADPRDRIWNHPSPFDVRSARIDLLLQARFTDGPYVTSHGVETLHRGEFVASLRYLAARWKWSKSRVERYLERCVGDEFISRQRAGQHGDVYLVVNYDYYQDMTADAGHQPRRKRDASGTKDKEGKEENTTSRAISISNGDAKADLRLNGFDQCWAIYPKREGGNSRAAAEKAYIARIKQGVDPQVLYAAAERYKAYCDAKGKTGTEFVKTAEVFYGPKRHYVEWAGAVSDVSEVTPLVPGARNAEDSRKLRLMGF